MSTITNINNYLIGRYQTLSYKLKKTREKLLNNLKEFAKFNYPKHKRVIYENFCHIANLPTYLVRKYLAKKLAAKIQDNLIGNIPREDGFLIINNNFPSLNNAIEFAKNRLEQTNLTELVKNSTGKHQYLLALPIKHELTLDSPLIQLALDQNLLKTVTEYIGVLPILNSVNIIYSPNQNIFEHSSQYFHLDPEGVRQVKIFIYLDEVTEDSGPFTLISAAESQKVYPVYKGGRLTDEFVSEIIGKKEFIPITGSGGTMVLVDTSSCFHFGSRPGTKDRPAILLQYVSPFSMIFANFGWQRQTRLAHLAKEDTPVLERYLLGASQC